MKTGSDEPDLLDDRRSGSGTSTSRCSRRRPGGASTGWCAGCSQQSRGQSAPSPIGSYRNQVLVDALAEGVDDGAFVTGRTCGRRRSWAAGEVGEVDGPEDAFGLTTTSSSRSMTYLLSPLSTASYMPRAKPPDPPRLPCSMSLNLSPSTAAASSKPCSSRTFWLPWSATIRRSMTASRSSDSAKVRRCLTQKSGRLNVVTAMESEPGLKPSGCGTDQSACFSVTSSPCATRSNQYQPPSANVVSVRSKWRWSRPSGGCSERGWSCRGGWTCRR